MADLNGGDLDRHITGGWGARSAHGGEEPDPPECEACGARMSYDDAPEDPNETIICAECADDPDSEL